MAMGKVRGRRAATTIPAGDVVKVVSDPAEEPVMVDVLWNGRPFMVFTGDLKEHAEELPESFDPFPRRPGSGRKHINNRLLKC